jgi:hypothetical protein
MIQFIPRKLNIPLALPENVILGPKYSLMEGLSRRKVIFQIRAFSPKE